ncbi:PAS domain-containing protein [Lactobacillus isalae]|uniref:PAS domain-containing protein n=1 Tax=Lactobacillus isalae TaxID=2993455 RepID=UPI0024A9EF70|nr:PAS domain-containing protein [Lactobacillus isalae]
MNENWKKNLNHAASNEDYVKLNAGLMKVDELNDYLSSFPSNFLAFNKLGEFTYYKQIPGMNYNPPELGKDITSLGKTEQEKKQLEKIFHKLSTGEEKELHFSDQTNTQKRFMVDTYRAIYDQKHQFAGINESIQDIYPLVEYYLKETGQKLVDDPDNPKGAIYRKNQEIDAESGASEL